MVRQSFTTIKSSLINDETARGRWRLSKVILVCSNIGGRDTFLMTYLVIVNFHNDLRRVWVHIVRSTELWAIYKCVQGMISFFLNKMSLDGFRFRNPRLFRNLWDGNFQFKLRDLYTFMLKKYISLWYPHKVFRWIHKI